MDETKKYKIAVVGLGYVGLPLAVCASQQYPVTGYDISNQRVNELKRGIDSTNELSPDGLSQLKLIDITDNIDDLIDANFYIITVPTPIDKMKRPDFTALIHASHAISKAIRPGDVVVYESTVYPGATREICIPILEQGSGLYLNDDFGVGYSPERINPGDKLHSIDKITKVVSGSNLDYTKKINLFYESIITAGTHVAESIEIAEAAKVIENTQRDINIALVNELSILFDKLGLETKKVLDAARTKWNFLPFEPGLVGGHCIGVDPYYLSERALQVGLVPELILAGRKVNDTMPRYVVDKLISELIKKDLISQNKKILLMGITFKENCPDIRNSKSIEIYNLLVDYGFDVYAYDPVARDPTDLIKCADEIVVQEYAAVIISVGHQEFKEIDMKILKKLLIQDGLLFDLKSILQSQYSDWSL